MTKDKEFMKTPSLLQYVMCYAVWIAMAAATIYLMLQVQINLVTPFRLARLSDSVVASASMFSFINYATIILTGILVLVFIIVLEHLLRTRLGTRKFWLVIARTIVIEAIIVGLSYAALKLLPKLF